MLVLKKLCEPNGIYGKFYSNKLNNSSNEYSLDKYKISIKNKDIKKNNNFAKKGIQITYEILQKGEYVIFKRDGNKLIINEITKELINNKDNLEKDEKILEIHCQKQMNK